MKNYRKPKKSNMMEKQLPTSMAPISQDGLSLTVIVPVRVTKARYDLIDRIEQCFADTEIPNTVDVIIVDDGSKDKDYIELKKKEKDRFKVMRTGAKYYDHFSPARARNFAAQRATGDLIMFMDADLIPYPGFFRDVIREANLLAIKENVHRFLMLPVIYLTEAGLELMETTPSSEWRATFINSMLVNDRNVIEKFSSGTSVIVLDRLYYLARGGQDIGFEGWGYEDYEFANRLIRRDRRYPLPSEWLSMAGNFMTINKYEGWKSIYRLYGDWMAAKAIYLFHIPHPIEQTYHSRKEQNMRYLIERMKEDASKTPVEPPPLPDFNAGSTLLLRSNPFCYDREFAPGYGHVEKAHEDDFADELEFAERVKEFKYRNIVFGNPYANEKLKRLYLWCRENSQPYVICERGALPDSVYHDKHGFLNDSTSYDAAIWDHPLSDEEHTQTTTYIDAIRYGTDALEPQSKREDAAVLRKRLGIKLNKKVLFAPFQQPQDTVIREFAGPIGSFSRFHDEIARLAQELGDDWVVVYKKHPTEDDLPPISGAVCADDAHVYDLLEICHSVALINSGVGIYGMMFGKPVFVFGSSWYAHPGLCRPILENESAATVIQDGFSLDYERVLRFVHYLRFRFYSFGEMATRKVRYSDGTPITATSSIKYYEIRQNGNVRKLQRAFKPISKDSLLFDRYRAENATGVAKTTPAAKPVAAKTPPPKAAAPTPSPPTHTPKTTEEKLIADARQAMSAGNYRLVATCLKQAASVSMLPTQRYRAAAEALVEAGDLTEAIALLKETALTAKDSAPIERRIKELSRSPLARKLLPEKKYKGLVELMK